MAEEKTKFDKSKEPLSIKKTKRNKRKTECSVNRRNGCGICGSLNIAFQGVRWCSECGAEVEIFTDQRWSFLDKEKSIPCNCYIVFHRRKFKPTRETIIEKCMDCGSVKSKFCPNNREHSCWKSWDGKKYCGCGFKDNKGNVNIQ